MARLLPEDPLARSLALRSALVALGSGGFLTGSAFYFTHVVGLGAAQVGLGLTLAGVASFVTAVPLGGLSDRFGPRRVWLVSSGLTAALFLAWPWVHGFGGFVTVMVVESVIDAAGSAPRGAYTLDAIPRQDRVRSMAYQRSALNIGFTIGARVGGLVIALPTDAGLLAMPYATAAILGVVTLLLVRLPEVGGRPEDGTAAPTAALEPTPAALRNVVIPLWLVQETDAPRVLLAWLFGTNTVLAVLLQVPASPGADTVRGALRASQISGAFFVASCLIVLLTHNTIGWVTIILLLVGHVTVTGAELFESAGQWRFQAKLSDPNRRGEYQGVSKVGFAIGTLWAPAAYTWLAMDLHAVGWLIIARIVVVATVALRPSVRLAETYLSKTASSVTGAPAA